MLRQSRKNDVYNLAIFNILVRFGLLHLLLNAVVDDQAYFRAVDPVRVVRSDKVKIDNVAEAFEAHFAPSVCARVPVVHEKVDEGEQNVVVSILDKEEDALVELRLADAGEDTVLFQFERAEHIELRLWQFSQLF